MFKKRVKLNKTNFGFTLLELLVSISIIAVLISLATVSYSSAQKKNRDAKRRADLKAIQNAYEQYYANCGYVYPASAPAVGSALSCTYNDQTYTFLEEMPGDPKSGNSYSCTNCDLENYKFCAEEYETLSEAPCVSNLQ